MPWQFGMIEGRYQYFRVFLIFMEYENHDSDFQQMHTIYFYCQIYDCSLCILCCWVAVTFNPHPVIQRISCQARYKLTANYYKYVNLSKSLIKHLIHRWNNSNFLRFFIRNLEVKKYKTICYIRSFALNITGTMPWLWNIFR